MGIHAAKSATRFEALEPIRQGIRTHFGPYAKKAADGLKIRHDHGSQYMSDDFQDEIRFLGMESSPSFVREPQGNGCAERFIRTLKENLLWIRSFSTIEELRQALHKLQQQLAYRAPWAQIACPSQAGAEMPCPGFGVINAYWMSNIC